MLELGHIVAGPSASLLLAELGADVIKVENPKGGDHSRSTPNKGSAFFAYNRNKRSVALDLKAPEGREVFTRLLRTADVMVDNFAPGVLDRLGFGYEAVSQINPRVVYCSIKGFLPGPYGHRPLLDEVAQMMGGLAYMTGPPGQPLRAGASVVDIGTATYGVVAILAALLVRERTGRGQHIQAGMFETTVFWLSQYVALAGLTGEAPLPMPMRGMGGTMGWAIYRLFKTADDRQVFIGVTSDGQWERFCRALGLDDLWEDPTLRTNAQRVAAQDRLIPRVQEAVGALTSKEVLRLLEQAGVPSAPVNTPLDLLADEHLIARGQLLDVPIGEHGTLKLPATPIETNVYRPSVRRGPPGLGEHTREVLRELGYSDQRIDELVRQGVAREGGPLLGQA